MELCKGTLGDLVNLDYEGKRIGTKRDILRQIVSGLSHLHTKLRVIHRDLKPDNILHTGTLENSTIKLADFGLCRIVQDDKTSHTITVGSDNEPIPRGTMDWMAPEIYNDEHFT